MASASASPRLRPAPSPTLAAADKFPWNFMEWRRQNAATQTENTQPAGRVGHLRHSLGFAFFALPSPRQTLLQAGGPVHPLCAWNWFRQMSPGPAGRRWPSRTEEEEAAFPCSARSRRLSPCSSGFFPSCAFSDSARDFTKELFLGGLIPFPSWVLPHPTPAAGSTVVNRLSLGPASACRPFLGQVCWLGLNSILTPEVLRRGPRGTQCRVTISIPGPVFLPPQWLPRLGTWCPLTWAYSLLVPLCFC